MLIADCLARNALLRDSGNVRVGRLLNVNLKQVVVSNHERYLHLCTCLTDPPKSSH